MKRNRIFIYSSINVAHNFFEGFSEQLLQYFSNKSKVNAYSWHPESCEACSLSEWTAACLHRKGGGSGGW